MSESISNKEVIERLDAYFQTQDPKTISRLLAAIMIDIHRMMHIDDCQEDEKTLLMARLWANDVTLMKFIKSGPDGDIKIHNV